jgi:hypothetical protein
MVAPDASMLPDAIPVTIMSVATILVADMYPNSTRTDADAKVFGHYGR